MPRPRSKEELIQFSRANFEKLLDFIKKLPKEKRENDFPPGTLNRNVRDVLAHLHHWHLMMQKWYEVGMSGQKPDMPEKGYTWKTVPELNRVINEKYKAVSLAKIEKQLSQSFESIQKIIQGHTNEELFEKKRYKWTGTTSLGSYLVSASSSHYDWALKLIRKLTK